MRRKMDHDRAVANRTYNFYDFIHGMTPILWSLIKMQIAL